METKHSFRENFTTALKVLNPAQRKAVDAIEGPVMVIAGPGTGKTHVLACRIANILATQEVDPHNILALTFTDAAAKNMRDRIVSMIGPAGYQVAISTFHAFCGEVISEHPEFFDLARESQPLTELERYALFEEILDSSNLELLRPMGRVLYYLKDVIGAISDLKREGITPEKFESILVAEKSLLEQESDELKKSERAKREKNLAKQEELLVIYTKYQAELRQRNRFDFDDMVTMVAEAFSQHDDLLGEYQELLQYILVDEYQDTNASQNAVVDLLASFWGEHANLFVVGDPHQSIFRFQGASVENMLGFMERYLLAQVITLDTGYRCPQQLYDAAHLSISQNTVVQPDNLSVAPQQDEILHAALSKKLTAAQKHESNALQLCEAPTTVIENYFIADRIGKLLQNGTPASEIAVLYKNHADAAELQELLASKGIPFETDNSSNVFDNRYVTQLIDVISCIAQTSSEEDSRLLFDVLLYDWIQLPYLSVLNVARIASKEKTTFIDVLSREVDTFSDQKNFDRDGFVTLQRFREKLEFLRAQASSRQFHAWFELLVSDEGLGLSSWLVKNESNKSHILAVRTLFEEIKKWVLIDRNFSIDDFLTAVKTLRAHAIVIRTQMLHLQTEAVTLCSIHKAKGQEWEYVFMMALRDKKWGNARQRNPLPLPSGILKHTDVSKQEQNQEDRRLFYVAITRAKKQTFLSYSQSQVEGKAVRSFNQSLFLAEVAAETTLIPESDLQVLIKTAENDLTLGTEKAITISQDERDFFSSLVDEFSLSVTALNAYLHDPKEFVYNFLLRVPRAKEPHMSFGTAMHAALEYLYKNSDPQSQKSADLESVQAYFSSALKRESLLDKDFSKWQKRGRDALSAYFEYSSGRIIKPLFTERFFGGIFGATTLQDGDAHIRLTGRIDRIDLLDAQLHTVRLVDYKTGKAKTENDIEAKTKTTLTHLSAREQNLPEEIRGAYKRQLIFYVLLAQLDESFSYTVADTVFEFVEPNTSGKIVTRSFSISQHEVELLVTLIKDVMGEIRNLEFLSVLHEE
ncbi:ATP-dependent helicase [Candidatus Woesebacteria bacterium]|nr:ATP-dependent helicase [Candidatus Woesebacteria bacterium]